MNLNEIEIKKYKARVKDFDALKGEFIEKEVEGYVVPTLLVLDHNDPNLKPIAQLGFVTEELDFCNMLSSGFCKSTYRPKAYDRFEIIEEVVA